MYNSMGFSIFTELYKYHCYVILVCFHHPKRNSMPTNSHSPFLSSCGLWQPLISVLSLCICLLWTFNINGIILHVTFGIWLLSLSMFLRYIRVMDCFTTSLLLVAEYNSIVWMQLILLIISSFEGHLRVFFFLLFSPMRLFCMLQIAFCVFILLRNQNLLCFSRSFQPD